MKKLLLLLFLSSFASAQEAPAEPVQPPQVFEFDNRCRAPVVWAVTLIHARNDGTTEKEVIQQMYEDYQSGPLKGYHPDTIQWMLAIVSTVYTPEKIEETEDYVKVLRNVEMMCIEFLDALVKPKPKQPTKST